MSDLLSTAARQLGIPTETGADAGSGPATPGPQPHWPRHPYEIAQDVLNHLIRSETNASVTPLGGTPLWRARLGEWTHIGRFEEAVAHLASHCLQASVVDVPTLAPAERQHARPLSSNAYNVARTGPSR